MAAICYDDETLLRYRFETLEPAEVEAVASHLRTCSECAMRYAELGQGLDIMAKQYDVEDELDDGLTDRVLARVQGLQADQAAADARQEADRVVAEAEAERRAAEVALRDAERSAAAAQQAAAAALAASGQPVGSADASAAAVESAAPPEGAVPALHRADTAELELRAREPQRERERERLGLWAWLGLQAGGSWRLVRLTATLATLAGAIYVCGGLLYFAGQTATIDTRVSGEDNLIPGSRGALMVRVLNQLTHQPVAQAEVKVSLRRGKTQTWKLFSGKTDRRGYADATFLLPDVKDGDYSLEVVSKAEGEQDTVLQPVRFHRAYKVHLSTDKPLYQPGQTIHIRTLVLQRPNLTPPAGKAVVLEVFDPKNNRVTQRSLKVSKFGIGAYSLELSDDLRMGPYRIKASVAGASSEMKVKVARYALPKYKIAVKTDKPFYLAGETLRARISTRYFFGKAVQRADVRVVLFKPSGAVIGAVITGKTDADGLYTLSAEIPADLAAAGKPETVMMEVAIKDAAGQEERKQHAATVTRDLLHMEVIPEGGRLIAQMANTFYVLTTTPDGKPVAGKVEVGLPDGKSLKLRTAQNGLGSFRYTPTSAQAAASPTPPSRPWPIRRDRRTGRRVASRPPPGGRRPYYRPPRPRGGLTLQLRGEDRDGRKGSRKVHLPVQLGRLLVATDQAFYRPGETVQVAVQAVDQYTSAWVEGIQEGQTVFTARFPLKGGKGSASLDLPQGVSGTLRLDVQARDPYDVQSPVVQRKIVVTERQGLKVTMRADKPTFRPGSPAKLRFAVTDAQGNPKAAAIGLTVVDESVFALAASRPALARAFFLLERSLMERRHNLSAPEALTASSWGEAEQQAGKLLLSLDQTNTRRPARFEKETFQAKAAGLRIGRSEFEGNAVTVAIAVGLVLLLVLIVAVARRLPPWAGGILIGIAACVALMIPLQLTMVLAATAGGALVGLLVYGQERKRFGWAYLAIPALGVGAVYVFTMYQPAGENRLQPVTSPELRFSAGDRPADPLTESSLEAKREGQMGKPSPAPLRRKYGSRGPRRRTKSLSSEAPSSAADRDGVGRRAAPKPRARMDMLRGLGSSGRGGGGTSGKAARVAAVAKKIPRRAVRVRRYFPETMYVHPELVTDEKGIAELTLPVADSITAWRVSALASSADGKLGAMNSPLKVFQDFFVDLDMPVALIKGDEVTIPVAVYNYLTVEQTVRLEVQTAPWFELIGNKEMAVALTAGGVDGRDVRIRVLKAGHHRLTLRADGTKLSDALSREILVSESGEEKSESVSGTLWPNETVRVTVQIPDAAVQGSTKLMAKLFPSRLSAATDGLASQVRQPHGCFEQTSSATYPNVLIYNYLKKAGKLTPALKKRTLRYIGLGYQRLLSYEAPGGGFGWFSGRRGNPVLTAYGLLEFSDMAKVFPVDPKLIRRTQRWLASQQNSDGSWKGRGRRYRGGFGRPAITAYIAWALAESGYKGPALSRALRYLEGKIDNMHDPYTMALSLAAFSKSVHKIDIGKLSAALRGKAVKKGKLVLWSPRGATVYYSRGRGGVVETTAMAAYALGRASKEKELVRGALSYLAASRDYRGTWHSTQGTILTLRTLLQGAGADSDQRVAVLINGQDAGTFALRASADKPQLVDLGKKGARQGVNVVELRSNAESTFQVIATYNLPWSSKKKAADKPLALQVDYGRTKLSVGGILPVEAHLTYRKPEVSGMVLLALGVPAGLTPLTADLEALKRSGQIARYELAAGKINIYLDGLSTNTTRTFKLRLKARTKIKTKGVGSLAYLYYHPEIRDSAAPAGLVVN